MNTHLHYIIALEPRAASDPRYKTNQEDSDAAPRS
jgi:hypothetical protein